MNTKRVESFRDLIVWQKSHELTLEIYKQTKKFPKREHGSLAQQQREAAVLIPTNIAAGFSKRGKKTKIHFYRNALNDVENIRYLLILADDLGYLKESTSLLEECDNIEKMLKRLIRSIASN